MRFKNGTMDLIALSSSLICAIHCASIPLVLSIASLSQFHFLGNPSIEWTMLSFALVFIIVSLWPSYKSQHHNTKPLLCAAIGYIFIIMSRLNITELWEISNTVVGTCLLSKAHFLNWKLLAKKESHNH